MKRLRKIATLALALGLGASPMLFASPARADQSVEWIGTNTTYHDTQELRQLTAPVALYPDAVLAQVLVASTYPDDVLSAARWLDAGNDPGRIDDQDWDLSVK